MNNFVKKILCFILIVFLCSGIGFFAYARYVSVGSSGGNMNIAKWKIEVNNTDITPENPTSFTSSISWTGLSSLVRDGYVAPGMTGTSNIEIDPSLSEVAMDYYIMVNYGNVTNPNISISSVKLGDVDLIKETSGTYRDAYKGTINLPASGIMGTDEIQNIVVNLTWNDLNTEAANIQDTDTGVNASNADTLNYTITVVQKIN